MAELYAGIGGFSLGFETLGASTVFASESNPAARKTFETNFHHRYPRMFGDGHFVGDIRKVDARDLPKYDVLTAGFPCQPFSIIGARRGFDDARGTAFFDIVRILEVTRPAAFFLENVQGLMSHNGGRTLAVIKNLLTDHLGYGLHSKVLRACDFGLPQLRPRLFLVGFRQRRTRFSFPDPVLYAETAYPPSSDYIDAAFIEIDRGTESIPTLLKKSREYEAYRRQGVEQDRNVVFPLVIWSMSAPRPKDANSRREALHEVIAADRMLRPDMFRVIAPDQLYQTMQRGAEI
ncbi:DNA (cytosine-5-)-methyltransferase [Nocardia aurea]|uniref:Cytosine-specific methyltransferase n=1 Tax=Nocardia aurea TaxID=2144174 RepID=A0ABV3FPP0_9NOCA